MKDQDLQYQLDKAKFDIIQLGTILKSFEHQTETLKLVLHAFNIYKKDTTDSVLLESHKHTESMIKNMLKHAELVFSNDYVENILEIYNGNKSTEYEILKKAMNSINETKES